MLSFWIKSNAYDIFNPKVSLESVCVACCGGRGGNIGYERFAYL